MTILSPFVFWAQNRKVIFLKVDLKDLTSQKIEIHKQKLCFNANGIGAQGLNDYQFQLDFYHEIDTSKSSYKITDNRVDFTLNKCKDELWPHLLKHKEKPAWLKVDYDRFYTEELDENTEELDVRKQYPHLYDQLQKQEMGYKKEDFKTVYLTFYNLFMFVGFMYVVTVLIVRYLRDGQESFSTTYEVLGPAMCFLQLLQFLEILHPLFGYVKGGMFMPFMQICGRGVILFIMLEHEPRLQKMPVVFYLFLAWASIEIIRYPYYMSQLVKKEYKFLTWLRYTAWMVCYPLGFTCEIVIVFRNLIFIEQSNKWLITIPFSTYTLRFSTILRMYLLFLMIPAIYTLMNHMFKARKQKLKRRKNIVTKLH